MNRVTNTKALRRGVLTAAAAAALLIAGAGVAGASGRGPANANHGTDVSSHDHGHGQGHHGRDNQRRVEGQITALTPATGPLTSFTVTTKSGQVDVFAVTALTTVMMGHATGALSDLALNERVSVTPTSTSTATALVAQSITIKTSEAPEVRRVEGQITALTPATGPLTSFTVTTKSGQVDVFAVTALTTVMMGHATGALSDLALNERVSVTPTSTSTATALVAQSITIKKSDH